MAEIQVRADQIVERARCEADHLKQRAREEADRVREEIQLERMAHEAEGFLAQERQFDLVLGDEDPTVDPVFAQFMSEEIEEEPSREWVLGQV